MAKRKRSKKGWSEERSCPTARLTSDLFIEIISRLPVKAVGRAKCVSKTWRNLIQHPDHRSKLPHALAGFFYNRYNDSVERLPSTMPNFTNVSGDVCPFNCPSFDFLPIHQRIELLDCCNGLLLLRLFDNQDADAFSYVVCNPATKNWTALPNSIQSRVKLCIVRLGFDPAVSSHFHVFEFLEDEYEYDITGLGVYSSEKSEWVYTEEIGSGDDIIRLLHDNSPSIFVNGCLHFVTMEPAVVAVDTKGKTWRIIRAPDGGSDDEEAGMGHGFIQHSQGCLHYSNLERHGEGIQLVVYVLMEYGSQDWILKHSIDLSYLFDWRRVDLLVDFNWVAIHQECNLIFFTAGPDNTLMSYDMDRQQVRVMQSLGHDSGTHYLLYVPLYTHS
ncbi:F-box protein At5g62510 [Brachypodium distachyon]|uniref:F-box domain-containing protein n=1 Tax=Brachypodium distachyon TaxID=15368 RepID=A0A0Q3M513_BRADI|nr:F-box protein At5g62510 [Brachypodium distachyon]XP_024316366.1 F-box protein At5g62510 [Brachypodium distachyon]KQJ99613.1 hypothetical protein BRADI_3g44271v3 [Brachypodium distachyon]|eukprot:XP_003572560.1 F-box protein At5g62510 [Brachypodium distachyon]